MGQTMAQFGIERGQKHGQIEGGGIFERPPQNQGVDQRPTTVAHPHATGRLERRHFRQSFAAQPMRQCAQRQHPAMTGGLDPTTDKFHHRRFVNDRIGVGWADQRGDAAGSSGASLAGDGRFVLLPRFPQAGAEINQSGANHAVAGVNLPICRKALRRWADTGNSSLGDEDIQRRVNTMRRIDQSATANGGTHQTFSSIGRA
jgi:hypothetical protein